MLGIKLHVVHMFVVYSVKKLDLKIKNKKRTIRILMSLSVMIIIPDLEY